MKRAIVGFQLDEEGDWVAALDCGHGRHVRQRPPFANRPWVASEAGRGAMLGAELDCARCDRMEWPEGDAAWRRSSTRRRFRPGSHPSTPRVVTWAGRTPRRGGVWARIHVLSGAVLYHVGPPIGRSLRVDAAASAVIVPEVRHRVEPEGPVRFFVEFSRARGR